jgi:trk system potassium uptake protein TrkH
MVLALVMVLPMAVDYADGNPDWQVFGTSAFLVASASGFVILVTNGHRSEIDLPTGFVLVNCLWMVTTLVAAMPYVFSDFHVSFSDAVFEAVSGLTTTGATVLSKLETLPRGLLLWRSITQWLGGIGIVAMGIVILPFLQIGGMQFFKLESSEKADKPIARFQTFSRALVAIYVLLTTLNIFGYAAAGMGMFDAINHAFATISSGGFSTRDASMMNEGPAVLMVGIVFMIAGALPFTMYMALFFQTGMRWRDGQGTAMVMIILTIAIAITIVADNRADFSTPMLFLHALFNTTSLVTTTGFASTDYLIFGPQIIGFLVIATLVGGAAGSTAGGFKIYRVIIVIEVIINAIRELRFPHGVFPVYYRGRQVSAEGMKSVTMFMVAFLLTLLASMVGLTLTGLDFATAFSGALSGLSNVGPGWGSVIGPSGNYASFTDPAKWIMSATMLLGRLEIMTVVVILSPSFWRR